MIKTLGIPVLNRGDLLLRCVKSIDHPIETLYIINNGDDTGVNGVVSMIENKDLPNGSLFENIRIEKNKNLGCGPSWNRIMTTTDGPWMLPNSDIMFLPGAIATANQAAIDNPSLGIVSVRMFSAFLLTPLCKERVGLFDENFFPAYFEDCDYDYRLKLSGVPRIELSEIYEGVKFCIHGEAPDWGSCTIKSDAEIKRRCDILFPRLHEYYVSKWGGGPSGERFTTPFNKGASHNQWEIIQAMRDGNLTW